MLLLALLFAVSAGTAAEQKVEATTLGNFLESTRRCEKELIYRIVPLSDLPDDIFRPYANTSAQSEEECARKCIERTVFCAAARFLDLQKTCQFSAKYIDCNQGHAPLRSSPQNIIFCVQCGARQLSQAPRPPRPRSRPSSVARAGPATVRSNAVAFVPQSTTQRPIPNGPQLVERETIRPHPIDRQVPSIQSLQTPQIQLEPLEVRTVTPLSSISLFNFHQAPELSQSTKTTPAPQTIPSKKGPVEEFVNLAVVGNNAEEQRVAPPPTGCSLEMMKPCILGFGRDCKLTQDEITGCPVCACPYKSPARGCAGPQGLKALDRFDMLNGREECPNDHSMQIVDRWYRQVDKRTGVDECAPEKEPYCGWQQDVNIWRMPRTKDECNYYCYSDDELRSKSITFFRL